MTYSLYRTRDGAGDSGPRSTLIRKNSETNEVEYKNNSKPEVGWTIQVGAIGSRTYQYQDYWQTTYITEILEESENEVRFRTGNSEYVWKQF